MDKKKTLILIDGHSLAYRSYFALERTGMRNSENIPTWGVYGFFKAFFDLINKIKPDAIAVSFDVSKVTFRTEKFPEYKANRPPMPDAMKIQVNNIRRGIETLNIPIFEQEGFEADDVIGTLSSKTIAEGNNIVILTGDQDSFQLLDTSGISVLLPTKGELVEYDRDKVFEKLGVFPEQIADYKALCGDASDNIPGVKGIGKKGAVELLTQFKTLEEIYENLDQIPKKRLRTLLEDSKEIAFLSKDLATIRRNIELDFDFKCCHLEIPNLDNFIAFLKEMEFRTFLNQLPKLFKDFENFLDYDFSTNGAKKPAKDTNQQLAIISDDANSSAVREYVSTSSVGILEKVTLDKETGQAKLAFAAQVELTEPVNKSFIIDEINTLEELIEKLTTKPIFAVDLETDSLKVLEAKIVGIALSWQENVTLEVKNGKLICLNNDFECDSAYIPVWHKNGKQINIDQALSLLKPVLESTKIAKVLHNAKYDLHVFKNYGLNVNNVICDTILASYIEDPAQKHGLKELVFQKFKYNMTEYTDLAGTGKKQVTLDKLDISTVADYASMDAAMTIRLAHYYASKLDETQQKLLYDMEMPLINILLEMERAGISLDKHFLTELSQKLSKSLDELEEQIYKETKYHTKFNINSPKQLGDVLFEHMGIETSTKTKTKSSFSTSAKVLESLAKKHHIAQLILEYRHLSKLKSTYVEALPKLINKKTGRLHTTFNQSVTTTGRLSSSDPNLQNIPIRTEIGNSIRKAFVACDKENYLLLSADYSQIELRFLADISHEPNLIEAFKNNKDIHTDTACKVFGIEPDKVTKEMRRQAKAVNFGIVYGQTAYGLSETLGITPKEAKAFIDKYFQTYPKVREYMDKSIQKAYQTGYVTTKFGRKRYLMNELNSKNRTIKEFAERAAINSPLQGSAADLIKLAMIKLDETIRAKNLKSIILLQVHDELVLEVPKEELETIKQIVKESMENVYNLSVPLLVDICCASNWMEAK